jgi:hypothetical protein
VLLWRQGWGVQGLNGGLLLLRHGLLLLLQHGREQLDQHMLWLLLLVLVGCEQLQQQLQDLCDQAAAWALLLLLLLLLQDHGQQHWQQLLEEIVHTWGCTGRYCSARCCTAWYCPCWCPWRYRKGGCSSHVAPCAAATTNLRRPHVTTHMGARTTPRPHVTPHVTTHVGHVTGCCGDRGG